MKNLEKILEEIDIKIAGSMGKKREGLLEARDVIRKHMNDDWIPVEKRLPEEGQEVWISIKTDCVRSGMYTKRFGFGMREGFICSDGFADINAVNAWKLYIIPEPYQPKPKTPEERQE